MTDQEEARNQQADEATGKTMNCSICNESIDPGEKRVPTEEETAHEDCATCHRCGTRLWSGIWRATIIHESVWSDGEREEIRESYCRGCYRDLDDIVTNLRETAAGRGEVFERERAV